MTYALTSLVYMAAATSVIGITTMGVARVVVHDRWVGANGEDAIRVKWESGQKKGWAGMRRVNGVKRALRAVDVHRLG
ncbi:hypothetical protein NCW_01245 [Burkholderia pseudomallei]